MTPLEINKKIAEIKQIEHGGDFWKPPFPNLPNWAEKIGDAWELLEEMPEDFVLNRPRAGGRPGWCCYSQKQDVNLVQSAAPMAICLAWLKWKESNANSMETRS